MPSYCSRRLILAFCFFLLLSSGTAYAQESEKVLLSEVLERLEQRHQTRFSYSHTQLRTLRVKEPDTSLTLNQVLNYLKGQLPFLAYDARNPKNILIIPDLASVSLSVLDQKNRSPLPGFYIKYDTQALRYVPYQGEAHMLKNTSLSDSVWLKAAGYQAVKLSVQDVLEQENIVYLKPLNVLLDEVEIKAYIIEGISTNLSNQSIEVDMTELGLIAGESEGDVFQLLRALPGIRSPNGKPGSFNLRGNVFYQNLIYFDNIPLYHTGHYFGTLSPYNPNMVEHISVYRNSLPAHWGGRAGGLINIVTQSEHTDSLQAGAFVNTVFTGAYIKTPIIKDKLSISLAARNDIGIVSPKLTEYSRLNFQGSRLDFNGLDNNSLLDKDEVSLADANGKIIYSINNKQQLSLSFLYINNLMHHRLIESGENEVHENIAFLNNWGSSLEWAAHFNDKLDVHSSLSISDLKINETRTDTFINTNLLSSYKFIENEIANVRFNTLGTYTFTPRTKVTGGYEATFHSIYLLDIAESDTRERGVRDDTSLASVHSFHSSLKQFVGKRWILKIGMRLNYYSMDKKWYNDPRMSVSYALLPDLNLKLAAGRSHQFVKQFLGMDFNDFRVENQFWMLADEEIPVLESDKAMLGATYTPGNWLFDFEIYAQRISGVSRKFRNNPLEVGNQNTLGSDVLVKRKWNHFESWISYTLSQTSTDFGEFNTAFFDQTHVLSLNVSFPFKRFKATASWTYMSGLPIDPDQVVDLPYSNNFPEQHQLDLSATYSFLNPSSHWKGIIGISMLNVYDQELVINQFIGSPSFENSLRQGLGFTPGIQLSLAWK